MAPLHFLPELIPSDASEGLLSALTLLGPILVPFASLSVLPRFVRSYYVAFPPSTPSSEIFEVLNNGALKVVVSQQQLAELEGVDRSRLVLDLELTQAASVSDSIRSLVGGVLVRSNDKADEDLSLFKTLVAAFPPSKNDVFVLGPTSAPPPTAATLKALVVQGVSPVIPTKFLTTSAASSAAQISIADAFLAPLTSDRPDGLFPTIVTSSNHSSRPLGLVYSSRESVAESINTARGVYQSRKHGLWRKGETSGSTQEVVAIRADCDSDALEFEVVQSGSGFCHLGTTRCFGSGELEGVAKLEDTLLARQKDAPVGSYTARLFGDDALLSSKIMEEAEELCEAKTPEEVAFEAADLVYFAMVRCAKAGVRWKDVEAALDKKSQKVKRRKGDAKPKWDKSAAAAAALPASTTKTPTEPSSEPPAATPAPPLPKAEVLDPASLIKMRTVPELSTLSAEERAALLLRPVLDSTSMIAKVQPIISKVRTGGDKALAELTAVYDRQPLAAEPEWSNVLLPPFAPEAMALPADLKAAIDTAYANVRKFHAAQAETEPLVVETQPGVVCSRFARPITRVGLYVPGGTAILPSSAIMLGAPAQVAGCETVVLATPPRADGTISPEVLYVASLVGVTCVVKAGGAQAVAAMAYGTETIPKVDKIFGPGNQWVTAAKMVVQNDISALVGIDMPAGPSEVLVIADSTATPAFVASDLLSQAEHGVDSQVVLLGIDLTPAELAAIEDAVDAQARALPRCDIARQAIAKSIIVQVKTRDEALAFSNDYAPEHLIMQVKDAAALVPGVVNAGSVFVGMYTPESFGDYASGSNHTLPTYGFARQFSGVNTVSFQKHITSQEVTEEGMLGLGPTVIRLAECEGLEAHANAVRVRLAKLATRA